MHIYQLTNRSTEQFMQNRKQVKYLLNCPTLKNDTQARFHVLYLLRAQCFFFCYISVHKKPHKVKVHIATVAPEFNVTPWPKQKSAKNRAQNSVQSNIFFKNNTRTKMFLLNQILFFFFSEIQQNKFYKIRAKYLNIIRWAEYFHLQEYLVCFWQKKRKKMN